MLTTVQSLTSTVKGVKSLVFFNGCFSIGLLIARRVPNGIDTVSFFRVPLVFVIKPIYNG